MTIYANLGRITTNKFTLGSVVCVTALLYDFLWDLLFGEGIFRGTINIFYLTKSNENKPGESKKQSTMYICNYLSTVQRNFNFIFRRCCFQILIQFENNLVLVL